MFLKELKKNKNNYCLKREVSFDGNITASKSVLQIDDVEKNSLVENH